MELAAQLQSDSRKDLKQALARAADAVLSLQFKATVLIVLLTLTVASGVTTYLLPASGAGQAQKDRLVVSMSQLARDSAELLRGNHQGLTKLAQLRSSGNPFTYVLFFDAQGKELAAAEFGKFSELTNPKQSGKAPSELQLLGPPKTDSQNVIDLTFPITSRSLGETGLMSSSVQLLGYARVGLPRSIEHQPRSAGTNVLLAIGALSALITIPLGFSLVRRMVSPLGDLAETMNSFSMGRLDVRSPIRRRDELGRLARAFNQMADQHQQTHMRIVRLNAELEERVAYRTHQLRELASRDPLTGLYNRRHFGDALEHRFAEASRYQTDLSCIMIDLDDFKSANDAFGHQIGDQVLQLAAGTIVGQLRSSDLAARYGGDEFILLLPQTDLERAEVLGARIIHRFNTELASRVPKSTVRMSMGIASLRSLDAQNAEMLVQAADHALYTAKAEGKNRIVMAVPAA